MKLTVITINFNNLDGLKKTFQSTFNQSFKDFEYIVIDGGSTDGSKELIEFHSDKITFWVSEQDSGIYNAMNKGIEKATGDYILFMNSGDEFYSNSLLKEILPHFESNEDIICGDSLDVNIGPKRHTELIISPDRLSFPFFTKNSLRHQAVWIKRDLHIRAGGYNEDFKIISDCEFMLIAMTKFGATYKHINNIICKFDRTGLSTQNIKLCDEERERMLRKHFPFFVEIDLSYVPLPIKFNFTPRKILKYILPYAIVRLIQVRIFNKRLKSKNYNID